jgi:D-alanyl-D-alanine carboxypeptidase
VVAFVFFSLYNLTSFTKPTYTQVLSATEEVESTFPTLSDPQVTPELSAKSVYAVDMDSHMVLFSKNPDLKVLPASTTKIVTALVALDYYYPEMVLTVGNMQVEGQTMGLVEGEEITFEDLLYGLLIFSANDAAEVMAQNYPGGRDLFVSAMNIKAGKLGLANTHFTNPTGFDGESQYSTARDLVAVSSYALKDDFFKRVVATTEWEAKSIDGNIVHQLVNINELIGEVDGVLGVKTGWTQNAQENLVTYVFRDGRKIMIALLGSQDRFGETRQLIDWIFASYTWGNSS